VIAQDAFDASGADKVEHEVLQALNLTIMTEIMMHSQTSISTVMHLSPPRAPS
jgi:hypothetical protein